MNQFHKKFVWIITGIAAYLICSGSLYCLLITLFMWWLDNMHFRNSMLMVFAFYYTSFVSHFVIRKEYIIVCMFAFVLSSVITFYEVLRKRQKLARETLSLVWLSGACYLNSIVYHKLVLSLLVQLFAVLAITRVEMEE